MWRTSVVVTTGDAALVGGCMQPLPRDLGGKTLAIHACGDLLVHPLVSAATRVHAGVCWNFVHACPSPVLLDRPSGTCSACMHASRAQQHGHVYAMPHRHACTMQNTDSTRYVMQQLCMHAGLAYVQPVYVCVCTCLSNWIASLQINADSSN
jgi:hypothetical protein